MRKAIMRIFNILSAIIVAISMIGCVYFSAQVIRWDYIPFFGPLFTAGIGKPAAVDLSDMEQPYTWEYLYMRQLSWKNEDEEQWIPIEEATDAHATKLGLDSINEYARTLLRRYMQKNNVAIVRKKYEFLTSEGFDDLLEILEFEQLDESYRIDDPPLRDNAVLAVICGTGAILFGGVERLLKKLKL